MKRLAILAPLALAACGQIDMAATSQANAVASEVIQRICSTPRELWKDQLAKLGMTETDMALACAVLNR